MRVECSTLEDFLENLATCLPLEVFGGAVYADIVRNPVGTDNAPVKFSVTFQASAVIRLGDGSEYLLAVGVKCGNDYMDASKDRTGTDTALLLRNRLKEFCENKCLTVRPGRVSE